MAAGRLALILLCCVPSLAESSAPAPDVRGAKYGDSFRLARSARSRVQHLLAKYQKSQQLGDENFEDRGGHSKDLPLLSTTFDSWLRLTDWERLDAALSDMQAYGKSLEWKRKELETEEREATGVQALACANLSQSIKHVELDLRDLIGQVKSQMSHIKNARRKPTFPTVQAAPNHSSLSKTVWERSVEGYIILRDLNLYLTKLARDFLLLASKRQ
ncbi:uncharacterized protein LOC133492222 [Syngnathoides biaculeatus]|uniref:uncharacterized protein LOC133492222 n=1 Tax=Syngnathoides biaculeatus TaxID=300417 RepID=UPI002ADD69A1|nr:uncharacterized protein LOC133492222 [Syngnathoides biaculeatus]